MVLETTEERMKNPQSSIDVISKLASKLKVEKSSLFRSSIMLKNAHRQTTLSYLSRFELTVCF